MDAVPRAPIVAARHRNSKVESHKRYFESDIEFFLHMNF